MRRRSSRNVPSSIRLDHGDTLVMDGLAQSEYEHCTASGLQGPRVNFTYRWVTQHAASCPLAGVVGCLLPTCAQGLVEPSSRWLGERENKWSSSWGFVFLLLILMSVPLVSIWMNNRKGCRHSSQRSPCLTVHLFSRGRARWVGGRRWPLSRRCQFSKKTDLFISLGFFSGGQNYVFYKGMVFLLFLLLDMLVAKWEPTPFYRDAYSVGTPDRACGEKCGQIHCKTTVSPGANVFFWLVNGLFIFLGGGGMDASYWSGKASWAW